MSCTYTHRYVYKRTCALRLVGLISPTPPRCAHHHGIWSILSYKSTWQLEFLPPPTHYTSSAAPLLILLPSERDAGRERSERWLRGQEADRRRYLSSVPAAAAGSAKGNEHISHTRSAPVTVQMASPGREANRAMKKDVQSEKLREEEAKGKGGILL